MSHLTEGELQAYLDGEGSGAERANVEAHLRGCVACQAQREELQSAASLFTGALNIMDRPAPALAPLLAELRAQGPRERGWAARLAGSRAALMRAAMLILGVTAAASATVPGSPVRALLINVWRNTAALFEEAPPVVVDAPAVAPAPPPPPPPTPPPGYAGTMPANGRIRILVSDPAEGTRIHVGVVDAVRASVEATGGAADVAFSSAAGRIEVRGGGVGDLRIMLPRSVQSAVVEVDGRVYLTKTGAQLKFLGAAADTVGGEIVFQAR